MARGWESKSVEAQQSEAGEKPSPARARMSAEQAALFRQKESLQLSRKRVLQQLQTSSIPRMRKILQDALAELDEKLSQLEKGDM